MQFQRKTRKKTKNIIILSVLAVIIAALTVTAILLSGKISESEPEPPRKLVEILDEEGRYNTYPTAYPPLEESAIMSIRISNEEGTYIMARPDAKGSFEFVFYDEEGKEHYYYPEILVEEQDFLYDDLYAAVTGDGYDIIPMLTYLIVAIRTPYFDDRIYLEDDLAARNEQLAAYGLSLDSADGTEPSSDKVKKTLSFFYVEKNEDGEEVTKSHKIEIGSSTLTGAGFYFRVDDRDYIYVTRELNYFSYALVGVEAFINPVLVAAGLDNNSHALYAPYLTPAYRQWLNELHRDDPFPTSSKDLKTVSKIIADVSTYMPAYVLENADLSKVTDSYERFYEEEYFFNTEDYKDNALYPYFLSAISGKTQSESFVQSFLDSKQAKEGKEYTYVIKKIEGLITEGGDNSVAGAAVGSSRYVKVLYELYIDGVQKNTVQSSKTDENGNITGIEEIMLPYHGILDLDYLDGAGVDTSAIRALSVGDEPESLKVKVKYDKKNVDGADSGLKYATVRYYVDAILAIYNVTEYDENGKAVKWELSFDDKVSNDSIVVYRYYHTTNGKAQTANTGMIQMKSVVGETDAEQMNKIRTAIKKMLNDEDADATLAYTEALFDDAMSDYITYGFENVEAYLTSELVIGFGFVNASERDPFYGESFYEKHDDCNMLYAVNQDSCEKIVKLLGGIAETSSAEGLKGIETVEVGITHSRLEKYGCYANSLLFALPRDMYVSNETADDELDDMAWTRTIDFVLYISDPVWDPETKMSIRYVASEMYDIIVKIAADDIGFIDLTGVDFWARRNLILINSADLKQMKLEFNMEDLKGKYTFDITHQNVYIDSYTGKIYTDATKPENGSYTVYDWIEVLTTQHGETTVDTAFRTYLEQVGNWNYHMERGTARLSDFYDYLAGKPVSGGTDSLGTSMFKEITLLLYYTRYTGTLTEEEQAAVLDPNGDGKTDDKAEPLMTFSVRLNDNDPNAKTGRIYCYEFYRCDDRRVMVRIFETNENGTVYDGAYASDFYVSILAFRKIVSAFVGVLNGKTIDVEEPYPDFI